MMNITDLGSKWKTLLVTALACTLCQCSNKEGKEKDFSVRMDIKNPLIHTVKRKIGNTEIQPNWFSFSFKVKNETDEWVKIEEILLYYAVNGVEQDPESFDLGSAQRQDDDGNTYDYVNYCTYPPSSTEEQFSACLIYASDINDGGDQGNGAAPHVLPLTMYIHGLAKNANNSNVYVMRAELIGVFLSATGEETDRFTKRFNFTTR